MSQVILSIREEPRKPKSSCLPVNSTTLTRMSHTCQSTQVMPSDCTKIAVLFFIQDPCSHPLSLFFFSFFQMKHYCTKVSPKSSLVPSTYNKQQRNGDHVLYLITRLSSELSPVHNFQKEKRERKKNNQLYLKFLPCIRSIFYNHS